MDYLTAQEGLPVLIPAGGILPLAGDYMTSHISNPRILEIQVYHGADGSFLMTEDDCSGRQSAPTERTLFRYRQDGSRMVFQMQADEGNFRLIPKDREYQIAIFGVQKPREVQVYGSAEYYWKYETDEKALYVGGAAGLSGNLRFGLNRRIWE